MAFYGNNRNVGKLCAVNDDKILVLHPSLTGENSNFIVKLENPASHDVKETEKNSLTPPSKINTVAISNCGNYLAASTSLNGLILWEFSENNWNICSSRNIIRKGQKIIFTNSSSEIIVADRGGDIFRYSTKDFEEKGSFLLGHICLVLDMTISADDKLLATCDRDGKIRVSHYPNTYNILGYCLGHQEFVSCVQFLHLSAGISLLSGSGDGTVRLWQKKDNWVEKFCVNLYENDLVQEKCKVSEGENGNKLDSKIACANRNLVSENQIQFSVRSVKYCNTHNLCIALLHLKPEIAVYKITDDCTLQFKQLLTLPAIPLDAIFCSEEKLLVLVKKPESVLVLFNYSKEQLFVQEETQKIPQRITEFYQNFSCDIAFPDDFVTLFKRCYDTPEENDQSKVKKKKI